MATIRSIIAGLHLPTLVFALATAVAASVTVNGQPLDLTTGSGRAVATMAIAGLVFGAIQKWLASRPALAPPSQPVAASTAPGVVWASPITASASPPVSVAPGASGEPPSNVPGT